MRGKVLGLAALALLAGCGSGGSNAFEDGFKKSYREKAVASCATTAASLSAYKVDVPRLCGCTMDKLMAGKSVSDLAGVKPDDPAAKAFASACLVEQRPDLAGKLPQS